MLSQQTVEYLKAHKDEITPEIIDELRKQGDKQTALDILDMDKDEEGYYLDAFGKRISFNGNRSIKKSYTKLNLSQIHVDEMKKCSEDIDYYKNNYVKIRTKSGVGFPEIRPYQQRFIDKITDDHESYVVLFPRQCLSGNTPIRCKSKGKEQTLSIAALFETAKNAL